MKFNNDRGGRGTTACKAAYPYTNEVLTTFDNAVGGTLEGALTNGHALYKKRCVEGGLDERKVQLHKIAELLRYDIDGYTKIITKDMGKLFTGAKDEVGLCTEIADYYTDRAEEFLKPRPLENINGDAYYIKRTAGVLVAAEPQSFPLYQIIRVLVPNFIIGDPVILKHASICPASTQAFDDLVLGADAPVSTFKNLLLSYDQVSKAIADPRVAGVCLTGSERGGASIATEAGTSLKKSSMGLGGNDAFTILEDADFDLLNETIFFAHLYNVGQVCTSSKRSVVVDRENYNKFVGMVVEHFKLAKWGDPMDQVITLAPLSSAAAKEEVLGQIELARENGAAMVYGGESTSHPGNFVVLTALTNITRENPIYSQEIFGSVASIYRVDTKEETTALANDSSYGLGGTVFSKDLDHTKEVVAKTEAGMSFISSGQASHPEIPFGDIKDSDCGCELSELGFNTFVNGHPVFVPND